MRRIGYMGLSLVLALLAVQPAFSQAADAQDHTAAYTEFYYEQDPQRKIQLSENFLNNNDPSFRNSEYRTGIFQAIVQLHTGSQNWAGVLASADRFVREHANAAAETRGFVYGYGLNAAQQTGNVDKMMEYGDLVLTVEPDNLNAQMLISSMIPERLPENEAARTAALNRALQLADRAHNQVEALIRGPAPEGVTAQQWAQQGRMLDAQAHATLGLIYLNQSDYDESVYMYEYVVELTPMDDISQFRLGLGYNGQATPLQRAVLDAYTAENDVIASDPRNTARIEELRTARSDVETMYRAKRDQAINAFAAAVAIGGPAAQPAREQLERLYRAKNDDSLDGLDDLIAQIRATLGD